MIMLYKCKWLLNANDLQMQMIIIWNANVNRNDLQIITSSKCKWFANDYDF